MSRAKCAAVILSSQQSATSQAICAQAETDLNGKPQDAVYTDEQYEQFNAIDAQALEDKLRVISQG